MKSEWIWMELGKTLRLNDFINLIFISACLITIQGREPILRNFIEEKFDVGLQSDIFGLISFKLGMVIDNTKPYCLVPV